MKIHQLANGGSFLSGNFGCVRVDKLALNVCIIEIVFASQSEFLLSEFQFINMFFLSLTI